MPDDLAWAMDGLPHDEKTVIKLAHLEGLTDSEIAVALGADEARVTALHEAALERLAVLGVEVPQRERVVHPVYLPFPESDLRRHFARVAGKRHDELADAHLRYYRSSAVRHLNFRRKYDRAAAPSIQAARGPCQIEKDERFWIVASLLSYFYAEDRNDRFASLLERGFGEKPPIEGFDDFRECFTEKSVEVFFEPNLPSPLAYREWLAQNLDRQHVVPYVLDAARRSGTSLEGATHVDAVLLDSSSGCCVLFEAKVLSDCSYGVTFDTRRNQIARNIDVMLDANPTLLEPLSQRDPERTLFALVTPRMFKEHPRSRMYGSLMKSYMSNPQCLAEDLPHRAADWTAVSRRLAWLTWEDLDEVLPGSCSWLQEA